MKRVMVSLLLMVMLVLSATTAMADNFTGTTLTSGSYWTTTGNWIIDNLSVGARTDGSATATHPVVTEADGAFKLDIQSKYGNITSHTDCGLYTVDGKKVTIEFDPVTVTYYVNVNDKHLATLGHDTSDPFVDHHAFIKSTDGKTYDFRIDNQWNTLTVNSIYIGSAPASVYIRFDNNGASTEFNHAHDLAHSGGYDVPVLYGVWFTSPGAASNTTPTPTVTPTPTAMVTPTPTATPTATPTPTPTATPTPTPTATPITTPTVTPTPTATPTSVPTNAPSVMPTVTPTPTATPTPALAASGGGGQSYVIDANAAYDFYRNDNPLIYSPDSVITYDGKGGYTVTDPRWNNTTSTSTNVSKPAVFTVSGQVLSETDHTPITGASVTLDNALQKTDRNGEFSFGDVPAGEYGIAVSAEGYVSKTQSIDVKDDQQVPFKLEHILIGGAYVAKAANETINKTINVTASPINARSPGFEVIVVLAAVLIVSGALVCVRRKN